MAIRGRAFPRLLFRQILLSPDQGHPTIFRLVCVAFAICLGLSAARAQAPATPLQDVLQLNADAVANPSRGTVDSLIAALLESDLDGVPLFLERWRDRAVYQRVSDGLFFFGTATDGGFDLTDVDTGADAGRATSTEVSEPGWRCCSGRGMQVCGE